MINMMFWTKVLSDHKYRNHWAHCSIVNFYDTISDIVSAMTQQWCLAIAAYSITENDNFIYYKVLL